jgi:hypothetical protein
MRHRNRLRDLVRTQGDEGRVIMRISRDMFRKVGENDLTTFASGMVKSPGEHIPDR